MIERKDSGIPWVGDIPQYWNTYKGKNILSILERPVKQSDGIITCFRDGEVTLRANRREEGFTISDKEIGYQGIEPGDLVVHGMDGFAGSIGISDSRGKATPVLNVMDSTENKRFLMYYLRSMAYNGVFLALSTGIRVRSCDTNWNKLKEIQFALPNLAEQQAIADFLDRKCADIDSVLDKTKASIEEYQKLKQSVITHAVTKGLRGDRPMKNSGIEWIGQIPEEWSVVRFKTLVSFRKGLNITKENLIESGIPVISYGQIHSKTNTGTCLDNTLYRFISETYLETDSSCLVKKNDFLFADTSEDYEGCGNCVYVDNNTTLFAGYHTIIAASKNNDDKKYIAYQLLTDGWRSQVRSRVWGIKVFSVSRGHLSNAYTILPPADEQKEIVSYLDQKCAEINILIASKEKFIAELELYKKSLIYEYATGKRLISE